MITNPWAGVLAGWRLGTPWDGLPARVHKGVSPEGPHPCGFWGLSRASYIHSHEGFIKYAHYPPDASGKFLNYLN